MKKVSFMHANADLLNNSPFFSKFVLIYSNIVEKIFEAKFLSKSAFSNLTFLFRKFYFKLASNILLFIATKLDKLAFF